MSMTSDEGSVSAGDGASTAPLLRGQPLRERLIESGLALLERSGAHGLSLREVARESGVSHMAPYGFFRNKNQLLSAIAAAGFRHFDDQIRQDPRYGSESPRERIVGALLGYVKFALQRPQLLRLMFGGQIPASEHCDDLRKAYGQIFRLYTHVFAMAIECGEFRPVDPAEGAFALWSLVHGFAELVLSREFEAKLGDGDSDVEASAQRIIAMFLRGLEP